MTSHQSTRYQAVDEMLPDRSIAHHPEAKLDYRLAEKGYKAAAAKERRIKQRLAKRRK